MTSDDLIDRLQKRIAELEAEHKQFFITMAEWSADRVNLRARIDQQAELLRLHQGFGPVEVRRMRDLEMVNQQLSSQLREAADRIAELEAELTMLADDRRMLVKALYRRDGIEVPDE